MPALVGFNLTGGNDKIPPRPGIPHCVTLKDNMKPARTLTFKCDKCSKSVQVSLQKVSACSHIQPYQGLCQCGELKRHATGSAEAVKSYLASAVGDWSHHH